MSHAAGYLDRKTTRSPTSFAAALAINGGILGALLYANPQMIPKLPTVIDTIRIDAPKPIEPPPPPQRQTLPQQPAPKSFVTPSKPLPPAEPDRFTTNFPPRDPPPVHGSSDFGSGTVVDPPRPSVFVGPQIDSRYAAALQPPYPPGKIRAEEEGVVVVRVLIGADGRVKRVEKIEGDDAFFRATAAQATKRWRFKPATRDGVAVEGWRTMTVRFELDT